MTRSTLGPDWERLCAERQALRDTLTSIKADADHRLRDPFGMKEAVRRHPILSAALAAGAGAVLVNVLLPPGREDGKDGGKAPKDDGALGPILESLRDVALRVATPWIVDLVSRHVSGDASAPVVPSASAGD